MKKSYMFFLAVLIFLCSCEQKGSRKETANATPPQWDLNHYDIQDELLFARLHHSTRVLVFNWLEEQKAPEPIVETDVTFGLIDMVALKASVIKAMRQNDINDREKYIKEVVYPIMASAKEISNSMPKKGEGRQAMVYYTMFRPMMNFESAANTEKQLMEDARHIALTRVNFKYWYPKIRECFDVEIKKAEDEKNEIDVLSILEYCANDYNSALSAEVEKIISQLKQYPQ